MLLVGILYLAVILGTAAGVRLLPRGWPRLGAVVAVLGLLWFVGPPALLSLVVAAAALMYQEVARRRRRRQPQVAEHPPAVRIDQR